MPTSVNSGIAERKLARERAARLEAEKLLEAKSAELYLANQSLEAANSGKERYLNVLSDFAFMITKITSVDELCWYVAREVVGRLGFADCVIYLFDEADNCIFQQAAIAAKNPQDKEIVNALRIPLGTGITGSVAESRIAEIVDDVTLDPRYVPDVIPAASEICVPMLHDGRLIGVIDCEDKRKNCFTPEDLSALETVASYTSAKIAERQAHNEALSRACELEDKVNELTQLSAELEIAKEKAEESSALKSRFVATISHEIRTPLAGILGSLDLLQDEELAAKPSTLVEMARSSGHTLQALLNDVIDFARTEAGTMQLEPVAFSIRDLIGSVQAFWQPHMQARGSSLGIELAQSLSDTYWGDLARIRQILNNYISNALKYAGSDRIILSVSVIDDGVQFCVSDSGPGLTAEDQSQLFTEFTRVGAHKRQIGDGAGLGLAICRQMAELMDGSVGVESELGHGSKFWLILPLEPTDALDDSKTQSARQLVSLKDKFGRRPRVLVAEDVPTNQTIIRMTLEAFGCSVTIVGNGIEAVEAARAHDFDVIFMDIAMPEMDGIVATVRIHELLGPDAAPPIYALTAHGMDSDRAEFEAAGMIGIVTKPFDRQDLYSAIEQAVTPETIGYQLSPTKETMDFAEYHAFDRDMVVDLVGQLDRGSQTMLLGQCIADLSKCREGILDGCTKKDYKKIADAAHQLKSVSGTFGLTQIQHLAGKASDLGRQGDSLCLTTAETLLEKLPVGIGALEKLVLELEQEGAAS